MAPTSKKDDLLNQCDTRQAAKELAMRCSPAETDRTQSQAGAKMTEADRWWTQSPDECFWLESTDRTDLGSDLKAPLRDEAGKDNWRYSLFQEAQVNDIVLHYWKPQKAVVGWSRVAGNSFDAPIIWGARGTSARRSDVTPHERPGYRMALEDFEELDTPLTLNRLESAKGDIETLLEKLGTRHPGKSLYFPFELSSRAVRPLQGYAFKLPRSFVARFGELAACLIASGDLGRGHLTSEILKRATPEFIWAAVQQLLAGNASHSFGPSTDFDLIAEDGRRLPPKAVFGVALSMALGGLNVAPSNFSGGENTICTSRLRAAGYPVVAKGEMDAEASEDFDEIFDGVATEGRVHLTLHFCLVGTICGRPEGTDAAFGKSRRLSPDRLR